VKKKKEKLSSSIIKKIAATATCPLVSEATSSSQSD
jgi:hypothetical protein